MNQYQEMNSVTAIENFRSIFRSKCILSACVRRGAGGPGPPRISKFRQKWCILPIFTLKWGIFGPFFGLCPPPGFFPYAGAVCFESNRTILNTRQYLLLLIRVANCHLDYRQTSPSDSNFEAVQGRGRKKWKNSRVFEGEGASNLLIRFKGTPRIGLEIRGKGEV